MSTDEQSPAVAVVGVGNELMSDDGIGPRVIDELGSASETQPPAVTLYDAGTTAFLALEVMSGCELAVVVDAIETGAEPGTIREYRYVDGTFEESPPEMTMHDVSFVEALDYGRGTYDLPDTVRIIGVEPATLAAGVGLSDPVEAAVADVTDTVTEILRVRETNTHQPSNQGNTV